MLSDDLTIAALSTPPGMSALAVIRVSGDKVLQIVKEFFGKENPENRKMILAPFRTREGVVLDRPLFCVFRGPNSFTGQDILEIFPHGNPILVKKILREITSLKGVRLADAGEFTRRAFENGRMDLMQAEAVGELIHAETEAALENAQKVSEGELSGDIRELIQKVSHLSALMELEVDFAEEEAEADMEAWPGLFEDILNQIRKLKENYYQGIKASTIPKVIFYGAPNAGKSSLINALLKEDRLLVSNIAGTTRDYVETRMTLAGGEVILYDTAGLGEFVDELDRLSQERTQRVLEKADLKIWVCDGTLVQNEIPEDANLVVRTRSDMDSFAKVESHLAVSSKTESGIELVKEKISERVFESSSLQSVWMCSERQYEALVQGEEQIQNALEHFGLGSASPEILAFELQEARKILQTITGEISPDSILNRIFDGFCIGK